MSFLLDLITGSIGPYIAAALAGGIGLVVAYFKGRSKGREQILNEQRKADIKAFKTREEIEDEVHSDTDAAVRDRLRDDARR